MIVVMVDNLVEPVLLLVKCVAGGLFVPEYLVVFGIVPGGCQ